MTKRNYSARLALPTRAAGRRWACPNFTRMVFALLLLGAAAGAVAPLCLAQSAFATLSGTVVDESGAVVPGAEVTILNPQTAAQRLTKSNDAGFYSFPSLPPATYTVTVTRDGFAPSEIKDVSLNVNDQRSLRITLKVGQVGATVNITDEAPLINESSAVSTVVDRQFVENLPLNGRSFNALISLTPGVVLTPAASGGDQGQFSVNGQRADSNYFTVDGVSANIGVTVSGSLGQTAGGSIPGSGALGGTNNLVSVDALQEFRIQTSTFAPEFGRSPGAQVQILTRSGTNDFHGNAFDYFRNDVFDANDWFANQLRLAKPPLRQNDFGGTLGGPLPLPRFGEGGPALSSGKNRTFFFFSYEGLRLRQPRVSTTNVPSLLARQTAATSLRPFLDAFPLPSGADFRDPNGNLTGLSSYSASFSNPSTLNATSIRIDHNLFSKLTVFGRYNHAPSSSQVRGGATTGDSLSRVSLRDFGTDTLTFGTTWAISNSHSNEARFNYSRSTARNFNIIDNFGGATPPPESLIFPAGLSSANASATLSFFAGGATGANYPLGLIVGNLQRQFNFTDNHSIIHGSHSLKFGVDYRRLSPVAAPRAYSQTTQFNVTPTQFNSPTNNIKAGTISSASILASSQVGLFFTNFSAYGQDTWKLGQRLTLTYGVRWDVNPAATGRKGEEPYAVTGFDNLATIALAPRGTKLYKTTYNNFAPRFGLAYQLSQKPGRETVLRGGLGIFYDAASSAGTLTVINAFPYSATKTVAANNVYPLTPANAAPPVINTISPAANTPVVIFDPELKLPRIYQWNFAVEQSLGARRSLTASYIAAVGRRLLQRRSDAAVIPAFLSGISINTNGDTSDYHGLQLQFQQRLSSGLQALASYSWSHSIDTSSSDFGARIDRQISANASRGPSDFDIRQAFNAAVTYNIPSPLHGAVGKAILGGWSVDTIVSARSALPVDVANTAFVSALSLFLSVRPNLAPGVPLYLDDPAAPGGRRINRAAFIAQPSTEFRHGTLGRNALRGFSLWQADFSLRREFKLTEKVKLQLRSEFFNVFNHPNFGSPNSSTGSQASPNPLFGLSTQMLGRSLGAGGGEGGFNPLYQVGGPRSLQFALKLLF
ncbi:MAG: TonB-dependent receptor [Blastocatellia bacterium]